MRYITCTTAILLLIVLVSGSSNAQSIVFDNCTDLEGCTTLGSCTQGTVTASVSATSTCGNPTINYSYKVDFGNNGSIDVENSGSSLTLTFPLGTSKITWRATNGCAGSATCVQLVNMKDCQAPNLVCRGGLTQNLGSECIVAVSAEDFVLSLADNCTPYSQLEFGLRRSGTGSGFPQQDTVQFNHCEQGTQFVDMWVRDANGNANVCSNYVLVQNNAGNCPCISSSTVDLKGCARTSQGTRLNNYRVNARFQGLGATSNVQLNRVVNFQDSCFSMVTNGLPVAFNGNMVMNLSRIDNATNGVTAYDLILISRHILTLEPFTSFYQTLAADVNRSQTVSTFDIVEIRKVLLGVVDTFPKVGHWQFVRPVPDPSNLVAFADFKDTMQVSWQSLTGVSTIASGNWVGVKSGDIERLAQWDGVPEERSGPPLVWTMPDQWLAAGASVDIPIFSTEEGTLSAWQMAVIPATEKLRIEGLSGLPADAWNLLPDGSLRILWADWNGGAQAIIPDQPVAHLRVSAMQSGWLSALLRQEYIALPGEAVTDAAMYRTLTLEFRAGPDARSGNTFFAPRPNPSSSENIAFPLHLTEGSDTILSITDSTGRTIWQSVQYLPEGYQQIEVPSEAFPQAGIYFWKIQSGKSHQSGHLVRQ